MLWTDYHKTPCKRIGEPDDTTRAVMWPAPDLADYLNGINLVVDGGTTSYPAFEAGE